MDTLTHSAGRVRAHLRGWFGDTALRRLLKNSSMLFGAGTITTLISIVQFPVVARWLGPEGYGLWGIVVSWVALSGQLLPLRLSETVIKYLSQFLMAEDESRALAIVKLSVLIDLSISAVMLLLLSLTAVWAANLFIRRPDGGELILFQVLSVSASATATVWVSVLQVFDRFQEISVLNIAAATATFLLFVGALALGAGLAGVILSGAVVNLTQNVMLAVFAHRAMATRFRRAWPAADLSVLRGHRRQIGGMLLSMSVNNLRKNVTNNADMLILGWFVAPVHIGAYRLAKNLAAYFNRLVDPLFDSLYPEIARLYTADGPARVWALVKQLLKGLVAVLSVSLVGVYTLSSSLVPLIFGPEYSPAIPLFYILILTNIWVVCLWAPSVMMAAGHAARLTLFNILSSIVTVGLMFALVPRWGAAGASVAQVGFHLTWLALVFPASLRLLTGPPLPRLSK